MMLTLYGIPNCDTVKKAKRWFEKNTVEFKFHNFRDQGISGNKLATWSKTIGWENLLNRRSTTWRNLSEKDKTSINEKNAIKLMQKHPTLIKRPVLENSNNILVGFNESNYKKLLK